MIGGSRDAQNRCVPVISLFNAVMLMGLILRLRLVDAALDQCHIETVAEPARALFKSLQHVADLTSVITVRLRLRLYTRSMMMGNRNRIKKEVVIFIFIHTARLFANRYLFCHCLVSFSGPWLTSGFGALRD